MTGVLTRELGGDRSAAAPRAWRRENLRRLLDEGGVLIALVVLVAVLAAVSPPFRTSTNLLAVAFAASAIALVAAGQTFVVLTGGIDLSVGSMVAFTGVVAAGMMTGYGFMPLLDAWVAIGLALATGTLVGAFQGVLITKAGINPFIVTLGFLSVLKGLSLVYTNGSPINQLPTSFKWLSDSAPFGIPTPVILMVLTFTLCWYVLKLTRFGRYVYAVGGNEEATRLSGIRVDRYKIGVYAISGLFGGMAGILLISRLDGGIYSNGESYVLTSVAAVVIGGTSLTGGTGGIWGTLFGVLLMAVVDNALVMLSISPLWRDVIIGTIIVLAVGLDVMRRRAGARRLPG